MDGGRPTPIVLTKVVPGYTPATSYLVYALNFLSLESGTELKIEVPMYTCAAINNSSPPTKDKQTLVPRATTPTMLLFYAMRRW